MVKVLIGDLFESSAQTWVNTINTVGVMGKGVALEFKKRFPTMYKDYVERCERGEVKLGRPYLFKSLLPPWILNFPTKDHWRSVANLASIIQGLEFLLKNYQQWGITSLAVPPLGCGQGQLEWRIVGPTLYRYLDKMAIPVELYAPYGTPHDELQIDFLKGNININSDITHLPEPEWIQPAWVALVEILHRIDEQPYHWPVGRTIFQKIAYVATEQGLPTKLNYQRGSYGPFAPEFKGVVTRLVNNSMIHEERLGNMFVVKVGSTFFDARKAYSENLTQWEGLIEKVVDLFVRMNTHQAEIVSTVMFITQQLMKTTKNKPSEQEVLNGVMDWKQRRKPAVNEIEVAYTIRTLAALGWLPVTASKSIPLPVEEDLYV